MAERTGATVFRCCRASQSTASRQVLCHLVCLVQHNSVSMVLPATYEGVKSRMICEQNSPFPSAGQHVNYDWRLRGIIMRTALCLIL